MSGYTPARNTFSPFRFAEEAPVWKEFAIAALTGGAGKFEAISAADTLLSAMRERMAALEKEEERNCPDCDAKPGERHLGSCLARKVAP